MKRTAIAPEHKKFFQINGFISFEELISSTEMENVKKAILARQSELPGLTLEGLYRSVPLILLIAKQLGKTVATLLDRKPIRLKHDAFIEKIESIPDIEEREVGLLLSPNGKGLFFTKREPLYNEHESWYLFFIFTANYVNNPPVFQ